jgi:hypothetical protein
MSNTYKTQIVAFDLDTTFSNREEYLAAVTQWKQAYKELSTAQRNQKVDCKLRQQEESTFVKDHPVYWKETQTRNDYSHVHAQVNRCVGSVKNGKCDANNMLAWRHASKVTAQEQYLAAKALA